MTNFTNSPNNYGYAYPDDLKKINIRKFVVNSVYFGSLFTSSSTSIQI